MFHSRDNSGVLDVVDPPRDGEFFFEEELDAKAPRTARTGGHPVAWSVGVAAVVGVLVATVLLRF